MKNRGTDAFLPGKIHPLPFLRMFPHHGAQGGAVQFYHDCQGNGRFHDGDYALWTGRRFIPFAGSFFQKCRGRTAGHQFRACARVGRGFHHGAGRAALQGLLDRIRINQFPQDFDEPVGPAQERQEASFQAHQVAGSPPIAGRHVFQQEFAVVLRQQASAQLAFPLEARTAQGIRRHLPVRENGKPVRMVGFIRKGGSQLGAGLRHAVALNHGPAERSGAPARLHIQRAAAHDDAPDGGGVAIYRTASGETVMAVCSLVPYAAEDVAAMRLVTSLTLVQAQLKSVFIVSLIVVAAILGFTVASGLYFVRGIVVPLGQVERIAASIARGELDVRLPVTGDERDEVDRLRGTINQMAEGLEETEKMKNEFISSVSHELRTPLTSIRGWVETLRTLDDPTDENYRKGLEIINNETARLYNMVEELLDFSRLQNGRLKMECRPLDLVAELTDAVLFCEARIQREGLLLAYAEPEEMIPVYADPDRLRQVFINILDNAIKYSAPGGRITVKIWQGEYKAFIEIIDQGRGIPPEDLENVKTKFYKGSNSVRGSGIGLALVDSIMTALDGTMDLKSTLGRGTVVTLGLPIYKR